MDDARLRAVAFDAQAVRAMRFRRPPLSEADRDLFAKAEAYRGLGFQLPKRVYDALGALVERWDEDRETEFEVTEWDEVPSE